MVTLHIKGQIIGRKRSAQGHKVYLNYQRDMSYIDRLVKLSLLPLEYRREVKDLELIYNARAGHIDVGHQYFFNLENIIFQIVVVG